MKVYRLPEELPAPVIDYSNYDFDAIQKADKEHEAALKDHLIAQGYTGKNTGGILQLPIADGCALYMLAEGSTSCLIHLPYGDAWNSPDVEFLPKREVLKRINRTKNLVSIFDR